MPELPEVQAHCERLTEMFSGRTLERFTALSFSVLKTVDPPPSSTHGLRLEQVDRRGKFLLLRLGQDAGLHTFVVHLMQAGRLISDTKQASKPRNGMARWVFDQGPALLLTEAGRERKAGIWLFAGDPGDTAPLEGLGVDAAVVTVEELAVALEAKNQRLHGFLRDQHGIAGIGRLLANEICHRARLSPFAMTTKLTPDEVTVLHAAIHGSIQDALSFERSRDSMSRSADRPAAVHHRKGELCPFCGDVVRAVSYNSYEVDYCATCQTNGKVLADNTTSKFLR